MVTIKNTPTLTQERWVTTINMSTQSNDLNEIMVITLNHGLNVFLHSYDCIVERTRRHEQASALVLTRDMTSRLSRSAVTDMLLIKTVLAFLIADLQNLHENEYSAIIMY